MTKINVLGVDQGLANVGFAVIGIDLETFELELITQGTIRTKAGETKQERIKKIGNEIDDLIEFHDVKYLGTEKLFTTGGDEKGGFGYRDGITDGNFVTGVLYYLAGCYGIEIEQFSPPTVKKQVAGSGKAIKKKVEEKVRELFDFSEFKRKPTNHAMDAIAIAITMINKNVLAEEKKAG